LDVSISRGVLKVFSSAQNLCHFPSTSVNGYATDAAPFAFASPEASSPPDIDLVVANAPRARDTTARRVVVVNISGGVTNPDDVARVMMPTTGADADAGIARARIAAARTIVLHAAPRMAPACARASVVERDGKGCSQRMYRARV
jgi:hypothetical protein